MRNLHGLEVGQPGQLPGDRARQAVVVDAPVVEARTAQRRRSVIHNAVRATENMGRVQKLTGTAGT